MGGTETLLLLALGYLLLAGGKAGGSSATSPSADGAALLRRAHGGQAADWVSRFIALQRSAPLAEALARWSGIESSGNPLAVSRLGERGLLQALERVALASDGFLTRPEWESLTNPATSWGEHGRLALKEYDALAKRAASRVADFPSADVDGAFYAKLWHQRPKDFYDVKMHGPALAMAAELAKLWSTNPAAMHRLRTAAVVAFDDPSPWERMA